MTLPLNNNKSLLNNNQKWKRGGRERCDDNNVDEKYNNDSRDVSVCVY